MQCDMCGSDKEKLIESIVEGVRLDVCEDCAKFGEVIKIKQKEAPKILEKKRVMPKQEIAEVIVSDYSKKIKQAREKKDLKQKELAEKIAEKESVIQAIETGRLEPPIELAKKLERFLHITLVEEYEDKKEIKKLDFRDKDITLGDLMKFKR